MDGIAVNWEPILWLGGLFITIISGLLIWIGVLLRGDREAINVRFEDNEKWLLSQQKEIKVLALEIKEIGSSSKASIEIMQQVMFGRKKKG